MPTYKKSVIIFVSFCCAYFANTAIDLACGPEADPYDYYVSFFHNNVSADQGYTPFYFTDYEFFYSDEEPLSEAWINTEEWVNYLKGHIKANDVHEAMYELSPKVDSTLTATFFGNRQIKPDSLQENTFLQSLLLPPNRQAFNYYAFVKRTVEPLVQLNYDNWNPLPTDTAALKLAAKKTLTLVEQENDQFLKLRYYYQAQRLLHYSGNMEEAAKLYDNHIKNFNTASHIKGWALALRAGEERWIGDTTKAAYLFSRVFALYPERRHQAFLNYLFIRPQMSKVLAMTKNDDEKAFIYAIDGFHTRDYNLGAIKEIYGCNPKSPLVSVLLAREINKLEDWYLTSLLQKKAPAISPAYYRYEEKFNYKAAIKHITALNRFCSQFAADRKNPEYALGHITLAYLAWIKKDTESGFKHLQDLKNIKLTSRLNDQKQIVNLLLSAQSIQALTPVNEKRLLPSLQWLNNKVNNELKKQTVTETWGQEYHAEKRFAITARNFYQSVLAPAYLQQRDTAKAAVAMLMGDVATRTDSTEIGYNTQDFWQCYLRSKQLRQIVRWKFDQSKSSYISFLTKKLITYNPDEIYELLGTAYLREHNYSAAVTALKQIKKSRTGFPDDIYDNWELTANPFVSQLHDYPKIYAVTSGKSYNKLQFALEMAKLKQQISLHPNNPDNYYKYATGLYNTGTHGNAWYLISYKWASRDYGRASEYYYDNDYVKSSEAEKYYLKARAVSHNMEFKAKCTFMAAKCQQKQFLSPVYDYDHYNQYEIDENKYNLTVRRNPYFLELKNRYAKTAYYKKAATECSYLQDFLTSQKSIKRSLN